MMMKVLNLMKPSKILSKAEKKKVRNNLIKRNLGKPKEVTTPLLYSILLYLLPDQY